MSDVLSSNERLTTLARFIRNQVGLADRPPGCIQLNNEEALLCAEALERIVETPVPRATKRDGNWLDEWGCCKVCDGEIPYGHADHCDIWKLEKELRELKLKANGAPETELEPPLSFAVLDEIRERATRHRAAVEGGWTIDNDDTRDRDYLLGLIDPTWTDKAMRDLGKCVQPTKGESDGNVRPDSLADGNRPERDDDRR